MWTQLPAAAMNWNSALTYAENLNLGGYTDWRLPNVKELETLTDHTLATATSTTGIKPSINRTMFAKTLTSCATTSGSTTVTCADTTGLLVGMPIVDQSDIAGAYLSNTTAPTVTVITNSTTFTISAAATATGSGLTLKALVPPTAYWSSSIVKAGTLTQAWLVEFGINSTVPAASGPTRNTQGIISYEIFASTYPVFAVRSASVTTQIAVSQGGTALTDAVSTVAYGNVNVGSTLSKTFTISKTGASALTISGVTIDGTNAANFTVTTAPATTIAGGGSTTMDVLFSAASSGAKVAAIHIASSDTSVGAAFDIALSGTGYVAPPTITAVANQTTMRNNATSTLAFTVGDAQTAAASLTLSATSSNTTLVPVANIVFGGSGASRTVTVTPAIGQTGTVTITVTVSNGSSTTSMTFTLTVSPPNILIIIADDYGLDASSLYSSLLGNSGTATFPPTPNIASLAANGVQFNHAYTYTVCSPTRSAILTGRYGFRTGTANVVGGGASNTSLQASEFTLPKAFAANSSLGYQLKQFGKWHLGGGNTAPGAIGGWPSFAGSLAGDVANYYSWPKVVTDGTAGGTTTSTSTTYATTYVVDDAVSFISTQTTAAKPWVAWVAFNAPHTTSIAPLYHLPAKSLRPSSTYDSLPNTAADIAANPLNYYNAMIEAMDTEIGRLLASVDLSKTDVIFIGDNGTPPLTLQAPYPTNHGKASLYEGGIRVPLIIRGPDVVSPGRTSDVLTHFVDLYSTILELAGINVATTIPSGTTLDSQSLLPVLNNQAVTRSLVFGDYYDLGFPTLSGSGRVLRNLQYKLIRLQTGTDQFYDLLADPYESTNLFANGYNGAAMTTARQTAYNSLVTQLANYNTPPTIGTIANQSIAQGTATSALALAVGDAELSPTILAVSGSSSNTTLVPTANVVIGGSGASRTVTVTPATGLTGTSTITTSVTDGTFTASTSFVLTVSAAVAPPTITVIATNPAAPTNTDTPYVTATVTPASGATISGVQLTYNTGAATSGTAYREIFSNGSTVSGITGAINAWTATANRVAGDVRERGSLGNHTSAIVLTSCATTNASVTVTCASTTGLIPGMSISGTNIPGTATISSVTNTTTFVMSTAATGTGSALSLTAAGVTLTGCSFTTSPTIICASTAGLAVGMGVSGVTSNPPGPVVLAITDATHFTVNSTVTAVATTITASGCGLEFSNGNTTYTDSMATTSNAISATAPQRRQCRVLCAHRRPSVEQRLDFPNLTRWRHDMEHAPV